MNKELIYKDDALACVNRAFMTQTYKAIEAIPAVDAIERKSGEWAHYPCCDTTGALLHKCTECGATVACITPYCPICGTKMKSQPYRKREGE